MALTSSSDFTVVDASTETASVTLTVLPVAASGEGKGRLVHPTLGTYDYDMTPDKWANMDGDAIIKPIWASSQTLDGFSNALWSGSIEDVIVVERWLGQGGASMRIEQLRMLISMWTNPPDPDTGYVQWSPSYANNNTYNVILLDVSVGDGVELTPLINQGVVGDPVTLQMRLVSTV